MLMAVILWVVLGLVGGFLASKVVNGRGEGLTLDIVLGIVGSIVGGWLFNAFGRAGVTGFNVWSLFVSFIGAIIILAVWHLTFGKPARA